MHRTATERLRAAGQLAFGKLGYEIRQINAPRYADLSEEQNQLFGRIQRYTQTSRERVATLCDAVEYVVRRGVPGDLVECGVWRGGSSMAIALTLMRLEHVDRRLWLYDTFGYMPVAGEEDVDYAGRAQADGPAQRPGQASSGLALSDVQTALGSTGYPADRVTYVEGLVEDTIPAAAPRTIALLRLDTDWYESTRHELVHLYPRLSIGGVLIIDDYGHFAGARKAVDEYLAAEPILLTRVDYTCRMGVKPSAMAWGGSPTG